MRIVIADEIDLVVRGVEAVLAGCRNVQVVGTYLSSTALLEALPALRPDIALLADRLDPDCAGQTLVRAVQTAVPRAGIILLARHVDGLTVETAFGWGVRGFLYKREPLAAQLVPALREVMAGRLYVSPLAGAAHLEAQQAARGRWKLDAEALYVLRMLAEGQSAAQVARALGIRVGRVYWVRHKLRQRFAAETNEALIVRALAEGVLG